LAIKRKVITFRRNRINIFGRWTSWGKWNEWTIIQQTKWWWNEI